MKIFKNGYFQLDYEPATDILSLNLPDMRSSGLSEARHCFDILVENVRNYYIKYLLLDSSRAEMEVNETEYNQLIYKVSVDLQESSLQKVARIVSSNPSLEKLAVNVQQEVRQSPSSSYFIRNFENKNEALAWLNE